MFVEGLPIAGVGFLIVFFVLAIIWGVLELMRFIAQIGQKKSSKADTVANNTADIAPVNNTDNDMDEEELVAVLTAAIAASLNMSTYNLKIKSYRRVGNTSPAWNEISKKENIETIF